MTYLVTINHPFQTVDDFHQRAGKRLASLIHRLVSKYPQLSKRCGSKRMLLALSVAWALTGLAKAGNQAAFEHIDEALSPSMSYGCTMMPQGGCVMVEGEPFVIAEGEQAMLHFLWDGFAIFIDHEGTDSVGQPFFDFADTRQTEAYAAMGEETTFLPAMESTAMESTVENKAENTTGKTTGEVVNERTSQNHIAEESANLPGHADRKYLAELVESVATHGDEHEIKSLLMNFSYIHCHDDYTDHLRGILLGRLAELATRLPMVAENHFHLDGDVRQFIARGNGYISEQEIDEIRRRIGRTKETEQYGETRQ